jgi:hypothetical protein
MIYVQEIGIMRFFFIFLMFINVFVVSWAANASVTFNLSGGRGFFNTINYDSSSSNIELSVSALTFLNGTIHSANVGRSFRGLGVTNSIGDRPICIGSFCTPRDDNQRIDGDFGADQLVLSFNQNVRIVNLGFTSVDSNDDFQFFANDFRLVSNDKPISRIGRDNGFHVFQDGWIGSVFSVGADERLDSFFVNSVTVEEIPQLQQLSVISTIPEPSTWLMMILGFGMAGLVLQRRRKYADA